MSCPEIIIPGLEHFAHAKKKTPILSKKLVKQSRFVFDRFDYSQRSSCSVSLTYECFLSFLRDREISRKLCDERRIRKINLPFSYIWGPKVQLITKLLFPLIIDELFRHSYYWKPNFIIFEWKLNPWNRRDLQNLKLTKSFYWERTSWTSPYGRDMIQLDQLTFSLLIFYFDSTQSFPRLMGFNK